jgi:hypothetical protein
MMDHTSLVRNVEEHKTYAMDPKALSEQNNNRKSLRTETTGSKHSLWKLSKLFQKSWEIQSPKFLFLSKTNSLI